MNWNDQHFNYSNLHVQSICSRRVARDGAPHVGSGRAGEGGVAGSVRIDVVRSRFSLCSTRGEEVAELSFVSSGI